MLYSVYVLCYFVLLHARLIKKFSFRSSTRRQIEATFNKTNRIPAAKHITSLSCHEVCIAHLCTLRASLFEIHHDKTDCMVWSGIRQYLSSGNHSQNSEYTDTKRKPCTDISELSSCIDMRDANCFYKEVIWVICPGINILFLCRES